MRRNKFGWNYPPGAANDPNAPYNQTEPVECDECDGYYMEDGHEFMPEHGTICHECGYESGEPVEQFCPECNSEDVTGIPCPNMGMNGADYDEAMRADKAEDKYDRLKHDGEL